MGKDTATAPAPRGADLVRNVALVGHAGAGKTTLAEALLVATGAVPRAGRVEDGTTCLDTEEVEVRQQRSVSLGVATVEHAGHRLTLLDTPGYAGLRRRAARGPAGRRRRAVRRLRGRRRRRRHRAAVGRVRRGRPAARRRRHPGSTGRAPTSSDAVRDVPARPRRGGASALHLLDTRSRRVAARAASACSSRTPDDAGGTTGRIRRRTPPRPTGPRRAHRGDHRRERGRDPDGPLPRRRGALDVADAGQRPGDRRRPRPLPPGALRRAAVRCRRARAARAARLGLPLARRARLPAVDPAGRRAGTGAGLRPRRPAGRRGRQDHQRPLRGPGLAGAGVLGRAAARTPRCTSPGTVWPSAGTPTTTSTSRIGALSIAARRDAAPGGRLLGGRHLRGRPADLTPRPATRCPPRTTRC